MSVPLTIQAINIPDWAWQRPETRLMLCERDIPKIFALARTYGGASQSRIAAATGLSQPRVNEILKGRRTVTSIDVLERIAVGLNMPDDARITLGIAPQQPDENDLTVMSGEISHVYPNQAPVAEEIRRRASQAHELDVLAVRALGIIGLNDSLLRPALLARKSPLQVRVLLLNPDCPAAQIRAGEIGESPESFSAGIRLALARLREVSATNEAVDLTVKIYDRLPVWRLIRLDDVMYVSAFDAAWEGHESAVYEVPNTPRGAFWAGHRRGFEDLWKNSVLAIGGGSD
jgi:transcriptional regulator with XRE-family HTH domain